MRKYTSIFPADVFAITSCADIRKIINRHKVICSDSQAALKSISSCTIESCIWAMGHIKIKSNEIAYRLREKLPQTRPQDQSPSSL